MKKGQVTLFIILGLILLLGAIIAYVAFEDSLLFKPPEDQISAELETQLRPFANSVSQCQQSLTQEAAKRVLINGGYLDNPSLNAGIIPHGNAVALNEETLIPYWHYIQDDVFATEQPQLQSENSQSISTQIARYVDERIEACIPWSNYPDYDISYGEHQSSITFTQQQTTIVTQWPISVTTDAGTKAYASFQETIDAPVQHLYEVAEEQIAVLRSQNTAENNMLRMLSIYATGRSELPPLQGSIELGDDAFKIWNLQEAQSELAEVIDRSTAYLTVFDSQEAEITITDNPVLNNMQLDSLLPTDHNLAETRINFYRPRTPLHYQVDGNPAVAVPEIFPRPPVIGFLLPLFVDLEFDHDITYPLIMSLEKNGYELRVAYEANIRNSRAQRVIDQEGVYTENPCLDAGGSEVSVDLQRSDGQPLTEEVGVIYTCQRLVCPLGQSTDTLQGQLPSCAVGTLEAISPELYSEVISYSSDAGQSDELILTLHEPKDVTIEVRGNNIVKQFNADTMETEWTLTQTATPIDAQVILTRTEGDFATAARSGETVELVPGVYDLTVIHVEEYEDAWVLPEEEICEGNILVRECVTIEEIRFEALPTAFAQQEGVVLSSIESDTLVIEVPNIPQQQLNGKNVPIGIHSVMDLDVLEILFEQELEDFVYFE